VISRPFSFASIQIYPALYPTGFFDFEAKTGKKIINLYTISGSI